ncbi:MAG: glycoside hydrolase family 88 protein [Oscillospiraceae bacterium]|jgi:unsaturated rhamnogalacturonyl hydrolase|nr:glycoside hydrolase family 88 protein [Oscillospiraceae bacterium]
MNPDIQQVFSLADASVMRFPPERLHWSWGQALYLYALAQIDEQQGTDRYTDYLRRYYDHHILKGYRVNTSDTSAPALGAFYLAQKTGEERYWEVVRRVRRYFETVPKVVEDMPNHLGNGPESLIYPRSVWVDSIMMYGVFTNWYAAAAGDEQLRAFAARQPGRFAHYLRDEDTGLFYHSYWTAWKTHYPRQPLFWGRGNGWVMAAIPLFLDYLPEGPEKDETRAIFRRLAAALLPWQRDNGYFRTVLNRPDQTCEESSATMLIAAGWFFGCRAGLLDGTYYDAAKRAFRAVVNDFEIRDGLLSMPKISGPTSAIQGIPYFTYKHTPRRNDWHYGLAAAFFAALEYLRREEGQREG